MIQVQGLHVRYPEVHALRGIDLSIAPGSFFLIGGPSGSGKSTLVRALAGCIPRDLSAHVQGAISVAGRDPRRQEGAGADGRVGVVFQTPSTQLFCGRVEEEVAFGPRNLALSPDEVAARVAYGPEATGSAHLRGRSVRHLSIGEQQRVLIAAVLAMQPAALILDEPTANLDGEGVRQVVQTLVRLHRRYRVTIGVVEHRLEPFLPYADRLLWLADGQLVADGPPKEVLAQVRPVSPPPPPSPALGDGPLVALRRVTAGYDRSPVLRDCSLALRRGEFAALVGPNGVGKTTMARVLAGLLRPQRGRVSWSVREGRPRVGFLHQVPAHQLVCDTVEEEVRFGPRNLGREGNGEVETVLEETGLSSLRRRPIHTLSVGEQQRTALAATISLRPPLLILDEPTVGQDPPHLLRMMDLVAGMNRAGQTVLLITHDHRLVERYAGRVWEMEDGRVVERKRDRR